MSDGGEPAADVLSEPPADVLSEPAADVLIVSLGSTVGLRAADAELEQSLRRAGARVTLARVRPPRQLRTLALTDLAWALAARRTAIAALSGAPPRAIVYSTTTAALLAPAPGTIRFDATAQANRPGRHGLWQRPRERGKLAAAPLLLPWSAAALAEAGVTARDRALVVPVPVEPSGPPSPQRDLAAITYAANPSKKGLDRILAAWRAARRGEEELVVAGIDAHAPAAGHAPAAAHAPASAPAPAAAHAPDSGGEPGVRFVGRLAPADYRALLRRARVYVAAPRREDYGIAQLEALVDGCQLVTTPAPGPYAALPLARAIDPRLVGEDLAAALRNALDDPLAGYRERALEALAPYRRDAVDALVANQLLPRLLEG